MDPRTIALIGGIGGAVIGLLGGLLGTYFGIKYTKTPAERSFMIKASIAMWAGIIVLVGIPLALALAQLIPQWVYWICFIVFFVLLGPAIYYSNKRQSELRKM